MTGTIVALYDDIAVARQVIEDLVKADFARSSISLVTNDAHNQYGRFLDRHRTPAKTVLTTAQTGFGMVIEGLHGILAGLDTMMIPGIGLAIAAGPIVAHLRDANTGTVSIIDALIKGDVPEIDAPYYAEGIRNGGTLVSFAVSDRPGADDIMQRAGSINIHEHIQLWQHSWKGFGAGFAENVDITRKTPTMIPAPVQPIRVTQARKLRSDRN
jgi:hypothetical protein